MAQLTEKEQEKKLSDYRSALDSTIVILNSKRSEVYVLDQRMDFLRSRITQLAKEEETVIEQLEQRKAELKKDKENYEEKLSAYKKSTDDILAKKISELTKTENELKQRIQELKNEKTKIENLGTELDLNRDAFREEVKAHKDKCVKQDQLVADKLSEIEKQKVIASGLLASAEAEKNKQSDITAEITERLNAVILREAQAQEIIARINEADEKLANVKEIEEQLAKREAKLNADTVKVMREALEYSKRNAELDVKDRSLALREGNVRAIEASIIKA